MCDPVGASQVLPYLAELSRKDVEFFLISFEKPEKFESGEAAVRAQINGLPIQWFPLRYTKNPPVISTLLDLRKMKKLCRKICDENKIDFIHARSYISALNRWPNLESEKSCFQNYLSFFQKEGEAIITGIRSSCFVDTCCKKIHDRSVECFRTQNSCYTMCR